MRVRCRDDVYDGKYAGYIPGIDLLVVAIEPGMNSGGVLVRVEHPVERSPYLLGLKFVKVTSHKVPKCWVIYPFEGCIPDLTPKAWAHDDFWRAYYDGEPWAEELYEQEAAIMRAEDPLPAK